MQDAKQRKSINEYTNIKAWLTVATRNTAYNYLVKMKHEIYISEESEKTLEMYIDEKAQEASAESRCLNELRHKKYKSVHDNVLAGVLKKNEKMVSGNHAYIRYRNNSDRSGRDHGDKYSGILYDVA